MTFNPPISKRKSGANDEKASILSLTNKKNCLNFRPPAPPTPLIWDLELRN